jgi:hypothetical protein
MLGSEVASLVDMRQDAGTYTHNWTPESMEFGVYFVRFEVQAETTSTSRLVKLIYMR